MLCCLSEIFLSLFCFAGERCASNWPESENIKVIVFDLVLRLF